MTTGETKTLQAELAAEFASDFPERCTLPKLCDRVATMTGFLAMDVASGDKTAAKARKVNLLRAEFTDNNCAAAGLVAGARPGEWQCGFKRDCHKK